MHDFHQRSKAFLRDVSKAAAWMVQRNVGEGHWWRWHVLTEGNPDKTKRPVFDDSTARRIFEELERRDLLQEFPTVNDASGAPAYLMRYDPKGWEQAIADGRPVAGAMFKVRRGWLTLLVGFLLGGIAGEAKDHLFELISKLLSWGAE